MNVELEVSKEFLTDTRRRTGQTSRSEEVVMVVPRSGGKILLHTKAFYPEGAYRLPTGKMKPSEDPDDAFHREFQEELGQPGTIDRKLGLLSCRLKSDEDSFEFVSHIYLAKELQADPRPDSDDEQITDFLDVSVENLHDIAEKLRNLTGKWADWGRFRAVAHEFVADELTNK